MKNDNPPAFKVSETTLIEGIMERYKALRAVTDYADVQIQINGHDEPRIEGMAYTGGEASRGRSLDKQIFQELSKHSDRRGEEEKRLREHAESLLRKANELATSKEARP